MAPTIECLLSWITTRKDLSWRCVTELPADNTVIPNGTYQVVIKASNFVTSAWGSHGLNLKSDVGSYWSNPAPGTLYALYDDNGKRSTSGRRAVLAAGS